MTGALRPVLAFCRILAVLLLAGVCVPALAQPSASPVAGAAAGPELPEAPQSAASPAREPDGPPAPGSIRGLVIDRDGAVYQGVRITLSFGAGVAAPARTATSDAGGRFEFSDVPAGPFSLGVSAEGFATQVIPGVLRAGESYEAPPIKLLVSTATSEVRVTASMVEIAQAQVNEEEHQRIFGAIPNFYVVYAPNAPPLNPRQKFHLAWRTSIDPVTFLATGFFAGIEQADGQFSGYGQGAQGYAKRFGANYADGFIGNMVGGALLPSLLKQDPRYFYKGTGTTRSRILYAIANAVMCKGDNGRWQVNYSGILGGMAAGGISNLYYPKGDENGIGLTFENAGIGLAGSAVQNLLQEFVIRKLTPKVPSYGAAKP